MRAPHRSRGAALLAALLTVALVATLSAAGLWHQWRAIEVEAAERERAQSAWVLHGALDWARLILREDARAGQVDHLAELWSVPLLDARLSTFLAADRSAPAGEATGEAAFLSGEIIDLQARLNLLTLIDSGRPSPVAQRAFSRLFDVLGLPPAQLDTLVDQLQQAISGGRNPGRALTDTETQWIPLLPQRPEQLGWLGLPPDTVRTLLPHVSLLPERTTVNLNTASATVIYAALDGIGLVDAQRIVAARASSYWRRPADAARLVGEVLPEGALVGVDSRYFEVRGRLRLDRRVTESRTLVRRDRREPVTVEALQQLRGAVAAEALTRSPDTAR